ncbi:diguanylate cyclase (GGDEF)-like protein [Anaerotaenia torta]|uniref:putative bifunctional diguanylate cyclase/phosphodiesterase n=1 Tax=Anaerotaenia torta TaxID=433293 RepID=UPI003D245999
MRFALPKDRTIPLIIFAIFGMVVSFTIGLFHISQMMGYSYKLQSESYFHMAENTAALIQKEMEHTAKILHISACYLANGQDPNENTLERLLPLIGADLEYMDIVVAGSDGKGWNSRGEAIDLSEEAYFVGAMQGEKEMQISSGYTKDQIPVLLYTVPVVRDGISVGLIGIQKSAELSKEAFASQMEEGHAIYLVDQEKNLVGYVKGSDIQNFNYDAMMSENRTFEEIVRDTLDDNLQSLYQERKIYRPTVLIWTQTPLGTNGWSVLAGGRFTMKGFARELLQLTNMIWLLIAATLFMFLVMIINQKSSDRKVVRALYLDPVTGGDNWYKFRIKMSKVLNSKQFNKNNYALVNFDINRFKIINDAYGYHKGDEVLKDIYNVIKKWIRPREPFTRYAADQFYILMAFSDKEELKLRIMELNDRIHRLRYTEMVRVFYGIYQVTERKDSIDRMGEFAQIAKNNIKGSSESMISFFDDADRERLLSEEEIEKSMNDALKNEEFHVYLQPKYLAREETIYGAEALVRWHSEGGVPISPSNFIPLFEKNGFIIELDYYMLKKVCELLADWLDKGYDPVPVSVNISRLHFANAHLAEIIAEIVDSYGIPRNLIELELTESAFLQNKQMLINTVIRLKEYGFLVSMDDFGAGYSSLNSLKDLPLDTVKLDGELFRITEEVERGLCVIRNTITMAKDLHMKVVAECIETREQVEFLCKVGCDIIQGYYFAKPMPAEQFEVRYFRISEID